MDSNSIKVLRNRIAIPLDIALNLLKKNNGDVSASEQEFHNDNIKEISIIAECNEEAAKESYILCNYDKTKAIDRINLKQVILTTRENPTERNEIGFILYPQNKEGEDYKTVKRNDAFIPTSDFDYILNAFEAVFPLEDYRNQDIQESFDACGYNHFDSKTCRVIIEKISETNTSEPSAIKFKKEVVNWFEDKLNYADYIVVYGNL